MLAAARIFVVFVAMLASALAQFSINGTTLVNGTPAVVNANQNIGTNVGADIDCKNDFMVDIILEWRVGGVVVGSTTVQRETTLTFDPNMAAGTYEIWVRDAGGGFPATKCGNLVVVP